MSISFLFGIHCHQPVDNFSHIVDEVTFKSYLPFMRKASNFIDFKFAVHYSGWLFSYIKDHHPDLFSLFKKLSDRGQIEFFSGGFYEPVLSSIPKRDRIGQIKLLNDFIYENFGQKPRGLWLTERVWDPSIVPDLSECGIDYIVVDDYHFISMGFHKDSLYGYYLTEQDGVRMKIFPIDQKLRYIVPFKEPFEIIDYLYEIDKKGGKGAILFDDGEKFGVWPKTFEWVYEKGWIDRFFEDIFQNKEIEFKHFYQFVDENKPLGLAYLPLTSYKEMGEWSLFPDKFLLMEHFLSFLKKTEYAEISDLFVKGAHWKNFFIKYPESNHIHKRILKISEKAKVFNDRYIDDLLFRSECNDVLWHGIFGGIYLPNLRDNAFKYIIKAEKELEKYQKTDDIFVDDLLMDGYGTITMQSEKIKLLWTAKHGGQIKSFDIKDHEINIGNTLSRRWEGYHDDLLNSSAKSEENGSTGITTIHEMQVELDEEVKNKIAFDWYDRNSFVDHFVEQFIAEEIFSSKYRELGDFVNQPFNFRLEDNNLYFKRSGGLYLDKLYETSVEKRFILDDNILYFSIIVDTDFDKDIFYFMELNFHFYDYEEITLNKKKLEDLLSIKSKSLDIETQGFALKIDVGAEVDILSYKVNTIHQSEQGVDFTTQGIAVIFPFKFNRNFKIDGYIALL
jgi:hypothetical protein